MTTLLDRLIRLKQYHKALYADDAVLRDLSYAIKDVTELLDVSKRALTTLLNEYPPQVFEDYPIIEQLAAILVKQGVNVDDRLP